MIDAGKCPLIEEREMRPLQPRMLDAMVLRCTAERTQRANVEAVVL